MCDPSPFTIDNLGRRDCDPPVGAYFKLNDVELLTASLTDADVLLVNANVVASLISAEYVPASLMYTLVAVPISYVFEPSWRVDAVGVMFSMVSLLYVSKVREGVS